MTSAIIREIDVGDLGTLNEPAASKAPALKKISERHHRLARLLAEGMSAGEAGLACGYVSSRVAILQADPTFAALVGTYRARVSEIYHGLHEKLSDIAGAAAGEILDRLEDAPGEFEVETLVALTKMGADRTGHGPTSSVTSNVMIGFAARLDAARQRIKAEAIEATVVAKGDLE